MGEVTNRLRTSACSLKGVIMVLTYKELEENENTQLALANECSIITAETFTAAGELLKGIKALEKEVDDTFKPIIKKAHEAHKEAVAQCKKHMAPLERAEAIVKQKMGAWQLEQERVRREEEVRLQAEARKQAEELALAQAAEAMKAGDSEAATAILAAPVEVAPVVLPPAPVKVEGVSFVTSWDFEITNPNIIPRQYLVPDEKKIRGVVRALKGSHGIPGVRAFEVQGVRSRG
jgi:hypothetical protein